MLRAAIKALRRIGGERAHGYVERAIADPDIGNGAERALVTWPEESRD